MYDASSTAAGAPQLEGIAGSQQMLSELPALLPTPRPAKLHWSTLLLIVGSALAALALLAAIAGVPGSMAYDVDSSGTPAKPSGNPMSLMKTLDGNMKWIDTASGDIPNGYLGLTKSINRNEAAIAGMMQAMITMDASVKMIETGLADVQDTTGSMRADMESMSETSGASARTMAVLGGDIGFLSTAMLDLATSTEQLTERLGSIETTAAGIAKNGTPDARAQAAELNSYLPDEVPVPKVSGGGASDDAVASDVPSGLEAYEAGLVQ